MLMKINEQSIFCRSNEYYNEFFSIVTFGEVDFSELKKIQAKMVLVEK